MSETLDIERLVDGNSPSFARHAVILEPGHAMPYDEAEWCGAIVFVTAGEIELVCLSGSVHRFLSGDILWLAPLPLRSVRNAGTVQARLLAISRRSFYEAQPFRR